ncbi:unnamed protein product [Schistosoma mansoni]|nr:unnamed protein product [Schistosoma mansoni]|eukprot:XP_018644802.1 unnamed protein product [Schistosoma mansoni]
MSHIEENIHLKHYHSRLLKNPCQLISLVIIHQYKCFLVLFIEHDRMLTS